MKTTTPARNMHRPVRMSCPKCGKRCYASRRIAKQQAKILFPGQHMGVYDCDWYNVKWFHLTSEPQRKKEARKEVAQRNAGQVREGEDIRPGLVPSGSVLGEEATDVARLHERTVPEEEKMMREPDPFVETALSEMYEKAEAKGEIPWNDAQPSKAMTDEEKARGLEETFGDE